MVCKMLLNYIKYLIAKLGSLKMPFTRLGYHVLKSFVFIIQKSYGKFIGCSNYPRCNYTKNIRD